MNNTVIVGVALAIFAVGGVLHVALREPALHEVSGRAATLTRATLAREWSVEADALDLRWNGAATIEAGTVVCGTAGRSGRSAPFAVLFFERAGMRGRAVLEPGRAGWSTLPAGCRGG